ncbi:MAG TPA: sensor histidine kinase, partial [Bacteroidales bacterium]|nr:sensor histidine kinase [Bacteroidales bacterium]
LNLFEEHIQSRKLTIHKDFNTDFVMKMDETLADILVTNLIKNAIIHNIDNGNINIVSASNKLSISNTGPALTVSPEKLFNRFVQSANSSGSMGLGLAIVKKICDIYSLQVHYEYNGSLHIITVEQKD